jgi:uncharacterized protein HemX
VFALIARQAWWVKAIVVVVVLIAGFYVFGQIQACGYHKGRAEYEARDKAREQKEMELRARAEASEKRAAELEPKAAAFDALAEQNRKIDSSLAKQIEEVSKEAGNEEAKASEPADCRVRAKRVCDLLSANRIAHDCAAITRESCGPGQ